MNVIRCHCQSLPTIDNDWQLLTTIDSDVNLKKGQGMDVRVICKYVRGIEMRVA